MPPETGLVGEFGYWMSQVAFSRLNGQIREEGSNPVSGFFLFNAFDFALHHTSFR